MFIQLFSIEWTRLTRRAMFWLTLAACALFIYYNQQHFYTANMAQLLNGDLKMPGFSFDLASSLDQIGPIAQPLMVILAALMVGNDYSQRTNQHWLMRAPRHSSLLAKFALLTLVVFLLQALTLLVGGLVGWYFKTYTYATFSLQNVNWLAVFAAPFYMTLVSLPALAFTLFVAVAARSAFAGVAVGLGYTQFAELVIGGFMYNQPFAKWLMRNLILSATYLLNGIGNKVVEIPPHFHAPVPTFVTATVYTLIFLTTALWLYRRQDVGG